jgi:hypothetical protein
MASSSPTTARRRRRGSPSVLQVATASVLSAASWASAFQTPGWSTTRGVLHHHKRPASTSAGFAAPSVRYLSSKTGPVVDVLELDSLTVKELRKLIKDKGLDTKGLSGKRKAELISYVVDSSNDDAGDASFQDAPPPVKVGAEESTKRKGTRMPLMPLSDVNGATQEPKKSSAKHKIYREVMNTYPPLSEYVDPYTFEYYDPLANSRPVGLGEEDIRHTNHPMLKGMRTSDLDVVFAGTASCTPGTTRGVSCTALRLQWRRNKGQMEGNNKNNKKGQGGKMGANVKELLSPDGRYDESGNGDFNGGSDAAGRTWLFDCGESTQVSGSTNVCVHRT